MLKEDFGTQKLLQEKWDPEILKGDKAHKKQNRSTIGNLKMK